MRAQKVAVTNCTAGNMQSQAPNDDFLADQQCALSTRMGVFMKLYHHYGNWRLESKDLAEKLQEGLSDNLSDFYEP
jgi:hypothetical protein